MKRCFIIVTLLLSLGLVYAQELEKYSDNSRYLSINPGSMVTRPSTRNVPEWSLSTLPMTLLTSYYDYMIGSFNNTPLIAEPDADYGGYFLTFHGKRTANSTRRVFYSYIADNGAIQNINELTNVQNNEGYPAIAIDPISGKPFYAWHANTDTDSNYEVQTCYDAFLWGSAGLISDPVTIINNPITMPAPYNSTDNEYNWPSIEIGPSPTAGMRRVYILTRNLKGHIGTTSYMCENVRIAYADFTTDMLEMATPLNWSYTSIPVLDSWNHDSVNFRRPYGAFTVGADGHIYYIGFHTASLVSTGAHIIEPDLDVFVCDNYGQGTWQRYTAYSKVPSWNPPTDFGNGPGYFSPGGVPYTNDQIFWELDTTSRINAAIDTNNNIHFSANWHFCTSDDIVINDLTAIKELVFNCTTNQFSIREIYPIAGTSSDSVIWQPWDENGDNVVDSYNVGGNPEMITGWNFPHWNSALHSNNMMFHYNNQKITKPNAQGWMASVWQNSWRSRQYNLYQDADYSQYETVPEIFISISADFGQNWTEPIVINSVDVAQFTGNRPMWVYPADTIKNLGIINGHPTGKLALMFYHDNTWGANSVIPPAGQNDGGSVKFMSINIEMDTTSPSGVTGFVTDVSSGTPISEALISSGNTSCSSGATGQYSLEVSPGMKSVTVAKTGYNSQTVNNVVVSEGSFSNLNFALSPLPTVSVTGIVQGGNPLVILSNATVTLMGVLTYSGVTNANGTFILPDVLTDNTYLYYVNKPGYATAAGSINIQLSDYDIGVISLVELTLPPNVPIASIGVGNNFAQVQWSPPFSGNSESRKNYLYQKTSRQSDRDITAYFVWRFATGNESNESNWSLIGSVPGTTLAIRDTSWSNLSSGGYKYAVKAQYSNTVLSPVALSNQIIRAVFGSLSGVVRRLDASIIPGAQIILTRINPNGNGPYTTFSNNLGQYQIDNIWYGEHIISCYHEDCQAFIPTHLTINASQNTTFIIAMSDSLVAPINVSAAVNPANTSVHVSWQPPSLDAQRILCGYKAWRFLVANEQNQELWTEYPPILLNTYFDDTQWATLASGQYKYAIKAVYTGNSYSESVFSNPVDRVVANVNEVATIVTDKLLGCFPNPFAYSTQISYSLRKSRPIDIEIFNLHGQLVKTMIQPNSIKGMNYTMWDATNNQDQKVPTGIYIIKMRVNGNSSYQKVILIK